MNKSSKTALVCISTFALLNIIALPVFEVWGGLFPEDVSHNFFDILELISEDSDYWDYRVVQLTMGIFIPSLLMFIASLTGSKGFCITSSTIGLIILVIQLIQYANDVSFEDLFDFENGSISVGTWLALILFIMYDSVASSAKPELVAPSSSPYGYNNPYQPPVIPVQPQPVNTITCPICRADNDGNAVFCYICGSSIANTSPSASTYSASQSTRTHCPACGEKITDEMRFCGNCGQVL